MIAAVVLNIIGMILIGIGLLVTIPVTILAVAHAYRILASQPMQA
jgi:uncharacterized membrane protein